MMEFMMSGGVAMWLILLFGLVALGAAIAFAVRPDHRRRDYFKALSRATLFCSLAGLAAGLAAVMIKVPANPQWATDPRMHLVVMTGLGEALCNGILGFTLLAVSWFVFAFGARRGFDLPDHI